jgi:hypothetical protein
VTSNINYSAINENFPVAGQDNDTQVFRDNFDTIKTSLQTANTEITALQTATRGLVLGEFDDTESGSGSDFNERVIFNAVLQNTFTAKSDLGVPPGAVTIDYQNGSYQVVRFTADTTVEFLNFPDSESFPARVGKVTLEIYGDNRTITFVTSGGTVIKKNSTFPTPFVVNSVEGAAGAGNPLIIEVWKHKSDRIFLNYLDQFSS